MKSLIAYFSRKGDNHVNGEIVFLPVGNTEVAAKKLQALTGADLYEIRRAEPYPEDYRACVQESVKELKAASRPALAAPLPDVGGLRPGVPGLSQLVRHHAHAGADLPGGLRYGGQDHLPLLHQRGQRSGPQRGGYPGGLPRGEGAAGPGLALRGAAVARSDGEIQAWLAGPWAAE